MVDECIEHALVADSALVSLNVNALGSGFICLRLGCAVTFFPKHRK